MVDYQQQLAEKSRPVAFSANMGLWGAVTLGVGALMGAGLYVLVGIAAAEAGPGLWIAYAICGLLTFLSVGMYAELSRAMPISGGGYLYAYNRLGSFFGFLVGWHLAVGSVFACALYALGFAFYLLPFLPVDTGGSFISRGLAAGLVVFLTIFALRGGKDGNKLQSVFTWGNLAVVVTLIIVALLNFDIARFSPMLPQGVSGVGGAISLIYISFFGYQLIANTSEEIKDAEKNVPLAMYISLGIAFFFYLVVAVVSVGAVDWQTLASAEAPLVVVATTGIGTAGGLLIGVGGILASVAALNGTLIGQARQIFAMGRDRIMPSKLAEVSKKTGIPTLALLAGAGSTTLVVILADLSFVAKAANFCLLVSMLPLTFALNHIYREQQQQKEIRIPPLKRAVPFAAFIANTTLLLTLDYDSLMFGGTVVGVGGLVFFSYSYSSEKRGQAGYTVHLNDSRMSNFFFRGDRILVPMANPNTQTPLLEIAESLSYAQDSEIMVLNVVIAKEGQAPREALSRQSQIGKAIHILNGAATAAEKSNVVFTPVVRAAKSLAEGILHAAEEERIKLLLMGWSQLDDATPSPLVNIVAANCRCHIAFFNLKAKPQGPTPGYHRIGVALGGRSNTALMVDLANAVVDQTGRIVYFSVLSEYYDQADLNYAREGQMEALARHATPALFGTEILVSDNPLDAIVRRTTELDLLILGAADSKNRLTAGMGSFAAMVAARAHCSVIIVKQDHKLVSLIPS